MQRYFHYFLIFLPLTMTASAQAELLLPKGEDDKRILSAVFENDVFADTDRGYTNGFRLAWLSSEAKAPKWSRWVANHFLPAGHTAKKRISVAIGQSMFAPDNLSASHLLTGDRPYAGWLYGSVGIVLDRKKTLDNAIVTLGVIGPHSYAEDTQKAVHHITGSTQPQGWDNQLHQEIGVQLQYERNWRNIVAVSPGGWEADITPKAGVALGNVHTYASVGATFRLGYDLPMDYGPPRIRPSLPGSDFFIPTRNLGGYVFSTVESRAVARNIFLDGNSFTDSHHVEKRNIIGNLQLGAVLTFDNTRLSYTHVFLSKEFYGQKKPDQFGALTFSYRF